MIQTNEEPEATRLENRARELLLRNLEQACGYLGVPVPQVEIRFDLRGLAAGQARTEANGNYCARFNRELLLRHGEAFLQRTPAHEAAHLAVFSRFGRRARPHGTEWQSVMRHLGQEPSRCHGFDDHSSRRRLRQYHYRCGCRQHQLSSIRHNRHLRGQRYLCRSCRQPLQPVTD